MGIVITIDGGAGTGTTALSRKVADALGQSPLNSGHYFRGLAWECIEVGIIIDPSTGLLEGTEKNVTQIASTIQFTVKDGSVVEINGQPIEESVLARMSPYVAHVSHIPEVRPFIRHHQQAYAAQYPCIIAEGRDLGTVVFPDAIRKIFLVCQDEERARRRSNHEGRRVTVAELLERDRLDAERDCSPMVPHRHAMVIDTTHTDVPTLAHNVIVSLVGVPAATQYITDYLAK